MLALGEACPFQPSRKGAQGWEGVWASAYGRTTHESHGTHRENQKKVFVTPVRFAPRVLASKASEQNLGHCERAIGGATQLPRSALKQCCSGGSKTKSRWQAQRHLWVSRASGQNLRHCERADGGA